MSIKQDAINTLRGLRDEIKATGKPMSEEQRAKEKEALEAIAYYDEQERLNSVVSDYDEAEAKAKEEEYRRNASPIVEEPKNEYRRAFKEWLGSKEVNMRAASSYQNEGTNADGGYLAPDDFYAKIVEKRDAMSVVRKVATVLNLERSTNIPVEGSDLTVSWVAEGATNSLTKQAFVQKALTLRKLQGYVGITEELLEDQALDIEAYLANKLARKFVAAEDNAFINGTAANNQPVGLLQSSITSTRTASATAVTADEVVEFFNTLDTEYEEYASWIISPSFRAALMKLSTGTGGNLLWQPSYRDDVPDYLLGRPVYVSKNIGDSIAADKFLAVYGDLSYYYIGDKQGINITKYDTRYSDGTWTYRAVERTSGILTNTDAVKVFQCHS